MRQFTTKEQTQHLIKLGFPGPNSVSEVNYFDNAYTTETELEYAYSIGDLIGFIGERDLIMRNICKNWKIYHDVYYTSVFTRENLIDALYDACVELKNKGLINLKEE